MSIIREMLDSFQWRAIHLLHYYKTAWRRKFSWRHPHNFSLQNPDPNVLVDVISLFRVNTGQFEREIEELKEFELIYGKSKRNL